MSTLDELPPDQRAALSLLLGQRKSYGELAGVLGISERAVHDRAHAALAVLAPRQARAVPAERREEIGDYLLGQQRGVAERMATRTYLASDEPARAWAQELAAKLAPVASAALPSIPAAAAIASDTAVGRPNGAPGRLSASPLPSSRLGGALLLGGIVAAIVVAVILLSGGGGSSHAKSAGTSSSAASTSGKTSTTGPKVAQRLTLKSPAAGGSAIALVEILSEGGKRAFYMAAEHLPPSKGFYYAIWLYNSPSSFEALSRSPTVTSNEKLAGGALLPSNAGSFHEMLVTRETAGKPARPGPIVLSGPFSLGG
ncbi:MAG: hypothetical protein JWM29_1832 [Solirubrobacterales bacterium]|jgi:hypothetical protein|nr:hypothetical protein [Solirubrobacterales bacterium]